MFVHFKQVQQSFGIFFNFKVQNGLKCHPWEFKGFLKVYLVKICLPLTPSDLLEFVEYKRQSSSTICFRWNDGELSKLFHAFWEYEFKLWKIRQIVFILVLISIWNFEKWTYTKRINNCFDISRLLNLDITRVRNWVTTSKDNLQVD